MSNDEIRIVVTDGHSSVTLGYIRTGKHYVFGQVTDGETSEAQHWTYHSNGYAHVREFPNTENSAKRPMFYGPTLRDFRGFVSTGQTGVSAKAIDWYCSPDFEDDSRGYDNVTYIDVSKSQHGRFYSSFICEAGFPVGRWINEWLPDDEYDMPPKLSYQVYTQVEPWVGVAHWEQGSGFQGLGHSRNFRPMGIATEINESENPYPQPCENGHRGCDDLNGTGPLCTDCYEVIKEG